MATTADQTIFSVLSVHAGLTGLVGARIYPDEAAQAAALPLLVFQLSGGQGAATHDEGTADRLDGHSCQLTVLAATPLAAASALHQARRALEGAAALKCTQTAPEESIERADAAACYGKTARFLVWNHPDA